VSHLQHDDHRDAEKPDQTEGNDHTPSSCMVMTEVHRQTIGIGFL
jgi:hypothetical protein